MNRIPRLTLLILSTIVGSGLYIPIASGTTSAHAVAQSPHKTVTIKGVVTDNHKEPLAGVTIRLKGTKRGTVTDADGRYTFPDVSENGTLLVTYIGMKPLELDVKGRTVLDIVLEEDSNTLAELTVTTGYQEVKRERMTGSVATISAGQIRNLNIKSIDQALAGNISGLSAVTTGRPGATASIHIRGVNSLTGNTQPIWIVDGMPLQGEAPSLLRTGGGLNAELFQNGIGDLSPDDIESITVLKDAAASAIYGARAANGVIVIKTKSGEVGKPSYNITAHFGLTTPPTRTVQMMNSEQKLQFEREMFTDEAFHKMGQGSYLLDQAASGLITREEAEARISELAKRNTNWFQELYRPAFSTQVSMNMSGGTQKTKYYTSANFMDQNGTEYNNHLRRIRIASKLSHNFSKRVSLDSQLATTYKEDRRSRPAFDYFNYALYANPYEDPEGYDLSWDMTSSKIRQGLRWPTLNARHEIDQNYFTTRYLSSSLMLRLNWNILEGLDFSSQGMLSVNASHNRNVEGEGTYTNFRNNWIASLVKEVTPQQVKGSLDEGTAYNTSYTWRNVLTYRQEFASVHYLDILLGQELSSDTSYSSSNYSPIFDQVHRLVGFPELPDGIDIKKINFASLGGTGKYESRLSSFFANATYSYEDRYVLSSSIRYDGSDIIGNDNQFTPLWNTSFRWNLHKEPFFKSDFVDMLSLRLGYGYTGSIDKNAFPFVVMRIDERYEYDGDIIPNRITFANPNVKWQTKRDANIGIEASLWQGDVRFGVNYYNNFVFNLLDNRRLPYSSGRGTVKENVANLLNRGWEIDLSVTPIRNNRLIWNIRGNMAINHNTVTSTRYKSLKEIDAIESQDGSGHYFIEGSPVGAWYGYHFAGIDPETGSTMVYNKENGELFNMDLLQNRTLKLKAPTAEVLGNFYPPVVGGFSTDLTYRQWTLTASFEYKLGHKIRSFTTFQGLGSGNRHILDMGRWRAPGDIANVPTINNSRVAYNKYMMDAALESGNYLRSTYMSLGYNLPRTFVDRCGLSFARLTLSGQNLFTITRYRGIDPQLMGQVRYPNSPSYNLSINIGI